MMRTTGSSDGYPLTVEDFRVLVDYRSMVDCLDQASWFGRGRDDED